MLSDSHLVLKEKKEQILVFPWKRKKAPVWKRVARENSRYFAIPPLASSRNDVWDSIHMMHHYQDLGSASDRLKQIFHAARPIRSTAQILVETSHKHGISLLFSQTSFRGLVSTCQLFTQASFYIELSLSLLWIQQIYGPSIFLKITVFTGDRFSLRNYRLSDPTVTYCSKKSRLVKNVADIFYWNFWYRIYLIGFPKKIKRNLSSRSP